ncbi:MAG: hypothetical protein KDC99_10090 [Cyclobacteriaceae bacterium]|nr:hypothetical protein [Cyclobacteriaceae bacterium]
MKHISLLFVVAIMFWSCGQQSSNDSQAEQAQPEEWMGMDEFHMVMAESFHPYRDSANIEPAKQYAKEMLVAVEAWSNNPLPEKVDNDEVRQLMADLTRQCQQLLDATNLDLTDSIGSKLTAAHDVFHHLQEKWYQKEEHHQ